MSFNPFSRFMRRSRTLSTGSFSPFLVLSDGKTMVNNTITTDVAEMNSDIFSIVLRVSSDIARVKLKTTNLQYQKVLDSPSNLLNNYNFKQSLIAQLIFTGNAYATIHRNGNQIPDSLEQIPLSFLTITLLDKSAGITYRVDYDDGRSPAVFSQNDMLHFKLFVDGTNENRYSGISPLVSLAKEINIQSYSNNLSLATLKSAIAPSYTLTVPEGILDKDAKENIREQFENQNSGTNAGRTIVLDQGLQLNKIDINPDIAKLLSNTTFSQTQIAKAFCIPDSYLNGQGDQQSSVDMLKSFYINALPIYLQPIVSEMEQKFGIDIEADISSAIDVDNSQLISNLEGLATPLGSQNVQTILKQRDIFPEIKIQKAPAITNNGGDTNNEQSENEHSDDSSDGSQSESSSGQQLTKSN